MAVGAVLFSLPIAFLGMFWVSAFHGYGMTDAFAVYSIFGSLTLLTVFTAVAVAGGNEY